VTKLAAELASQPFHAALQIDGAAGIHHEGLQPIFVEYVLDHISCNGAHQPKGRGVLLSNTSSMSEIAIFRQQQLQGNLGESHSGL
jgi:hypothetical protein